MSRSNRTVPAAHDTRREFLGLAGKLAATSALAGVAVPRVHAAGESTIKLALIGCGGRGSGAVANALSAPRRSGQAVTVRGDHHRRARALARVLVEMVLGLCSWLALEFLLDLTSGCPRQGD